MSVGQTSRRAGPYTGTGLVSQYPFTFRIFTQTELRVLRSEGEEIDAPDEELAYGTDYTVSLNADQEASPGGTVTLASPLAEGLRLSILSNVPSTQTVTITNYDGMQPRTLNTVHDKLTILIQQLEEQLERTLLIPGSSNETPDQLMQRLLAAQETAQAAADEAVSAKDEAQEILDDVKDYGEAATVLEPVKDDIPTLAEVVDQLKTVSNNITSVSVIANDLDTTFKDAIEDLGDLDTDPDPGQTPQISGGYVKTLADNIDDLVAIANNLEDILSLTTEIDKIPGYLTEMDQQVDAAEAARDEALEAAKTAAYAYRYSATPIVANGTAPLTNIQPQTNIKVGDHIVDSVGNVFAITVVTPATEETEDTPATAATFTVGALLTSIKGAKGDQGEQGYHFTPSVSAEGVLSWSNDGNLPNPASVNIKGQKGDQGDPGPQGVPGTTDFNQLTNKPTLGTLAAKDEVSAEELADTLDLGELSDE